MTREQMIDEAVKRAYRFDDYQHRSYAIAHMQRHLAKGHCGIAGVVRAKVYRIISEREHFADVVARGT